MLFYYMRQLDDRVIDHGLMHFYISRHSFLIERDLDASVYEIDDQKGI